MAEIVTFQKPVNKASSRVKEGEISALLDLSHFGGVFAQRQADAQSATIDIHGETYAKGFLMTVLPFFQAAAPALLEEMILRPAKKSPALSQFMDRIEYNRGHKSWDRQIDALIDNHVMLGNADYAFDADSFKQKMQVTEWSKMEHNHARTEAIRAMSAPPVIQR